MTDSKRTPHSRPLQTWLAILKDRTNVEWYVRVSQNSHGFEMERPWRLRIKTTQIALSLKAEQISQIE